MVSSSPRSRCCIVVVCVAALLSVITGIGRVYICPSASLVRTFNVNTGWTVETQTSHRWIDQSTAVANQQMSFGWRHRGNQPGTGTIIQLQKSSHILQSFDGGSMWQFVFQLPSPIQIGTRYNFKPLSQRLRTDANRSGKYEWTVSLREGEFLGFKYGNPNGYPLMSDADARASLTVLRRGMGGALVEVDVIWPRHFVSKDQYHVHWD